MGDFVVVGICFWVECFCCVYFVELVDFGYVCVFLFGLRDWLDRWG